MKTSLRQEIYDILSKYGPMSIAQICAKNHIAPNKAKGVIGGTIKWHPGKYFRIVKYIPNPTKPSNQLAVFAIAEDDKPSRPEPQPAIERPEGIATPRPRKHRENLTSNPARIVVLRPGAMDASTLPSRCGNQLIYPVAR